MDNVDSSLQEPAPDAGKRFAANTAWVFSGHLVGKFASFVFFVLVARILGVREYGYFNFAVSFVPLFLIFGTLGVDVTMVREAAKDRSKLSAFFATGLIMRLVLGTAGLVAALGIGSLFADNSSAYMTLLFVGCALLIDEITNFLTTVFRIFERMRFNAITLSTNRIVSTALAVGIATAGGGLVAVVGAYMLGSLAALFFAWWALVRYFPPLHLRHASRRVARELFSKSKELGVAGFFNLILFRIDAVMVEAIAGVVAVGFYGVAYRFFESFLFVAWGVMSVALPRIAKQGWGRATQGTFELTMALALTFYLPIAVGAPFVDEWLVKGLFGSRYVDAAEAVPWLTGAGVFYAITYIARVTCIALGERNAIAPIAVFVLATNVALNLYLIPREGFVGAAIATFVAGLLEAMLTVLVLRSIGIDVVRLPLVAVPTIAAAIMACVMIVAGVEASAALVVGTLTYLTTLVVAARLIAPQRARGAMNLFRKRVSAPGGE